MVDAQARLLVRSDPESHQLQQAHAKPQAHGRHYDEDDCRRLLLDLERQPAIMDTKTKRRGEVVRGQTRSRVRW